MTPLTPRLARQGILRHSPWDALLVVLAAAHGVVLLLIGAWSRVGPWSPLVGAWSPLVRAWSPDHALTLAVVAVGLWWNSNTISHNFIHRPFFRSRGLNVLFALYLSALLGIPQSIWRGRHLAHHAGVPWRLKPSRLMAAEVLLVLAVWGTLATFYGTFFLTTYLPGYALGLGLCYLHGYYEHTRGTISHYGFLYNLLFFNDGYHVEHHARPAAHWTDLPQTIQRDATTSRWPAVLRWLDALSLDGLERGVLRSAILQRFMLNRHERAFRRLLAGAWSGDHAPTRGDHAPTQAAPRIAIVGGGLFPRTLLVLRRLVPEVSFVVIDRSAENIAVAQALAPADVRFEHACYDPNMVQGFDAVVFPLAFSGDRAAIYRSPPAPVVFVHDWIWRRRGASTVISWLLLKRLNLVRPVEGNHESKQPPGRVHRGQTACPGRS